MKRYLIAAILLAASAGAAQARPCLESDGYAAQYKIREIVGDDIFGFDLTGKDRGDRHWFIRTKLAPWARKIPDACVRVEALDYINAMLSQLSEPGSHVDAGEAQAQGRATMDSIKWPKP